MIASPCDPPTVHLVLTPQLLSGSDRVLNTRSPHLLPRLVTSDGTECCSQVFSTNSRCCHRTLVWASFVLLFCLNGRNKSSWRRRIFLRLWSFERSSLQEPEHGESHASYDKQEQEGNRPAAYLRSSSLLPVSFEPGVTGSSIRLSSTNAHAVRNSIPVL